MRKSFARAGFGLVALLLVVSLPEHASQAEEDAPLASRPQWAADVLGIEELYAVSRGAGARIAMIDSAVWVEHPDLEGADIRTHVVRGHEVVDEPAGPPSSHATAVAGVLVAQPYNGIGYAGVAPDATLLAIDIGSKDVEGQSTIGDVITAVELAVDQGADVISLSLATDTDAPELQDALREAAEAGVVLVAGVGNNADDPDDPNAPQYPGAYPETIGVGAVDESLEIWESSTRGPQVDFVAPGADVGLLGNPDEPYRTGSGTSYAAPHVGGLVALMRAANRSIDTEGARAIFVDNREDLSGDNRDEVYGFGLPRALDSVHATQARLSVFRNEFFDERDCDQLDVGLAPGQATWSGVGDQSSSIRLQLWDEPARMERTTFHEWIGIGFLDKRTQWRFDFDELGASEETAKRYEFALGTSTDPRDYVVASHRDDGVVAEVDGPIETWLGDLTRTDTSARPGLQPIRRIGDDRCHAYQSRTVDEGEAVESQINTGVLGFSQHWRAMLCERGQPVPAPGDYAFVGIANRHTFIEENQPNLDTGRYPLISMPPEGPTMRLAGESRLRTARLISEHRFCNAQTDLVVLTTAGDYPDALTAAALAGQRGAPIMLLSDNPYDQPTVELNRLDPDTIIFVGGEAVIREEALETARQRHTDDVRRIAGASRFETAAAIAEFAYPDGADVVYLATGLGFADALAGAVPAVRDGAPILLTTRGQLAAPTRRALEQLAPGSIKVLGGAGAVSDDVMNELALLADDVSRVAGPERWSTAVSASRATFADGEGPLVYLATGLDFPDALAGGPSAALDDAPLLLVPRSGSLPGIVAAELQRLGTRAVTVLGGPGAVSDEMVQQVLDALP